MPTVRQVVAPAVTLLLAGTPLSSQTYEDHQLLRLNGHLLRELRLSGTSLPLGTDRGHEFVQQAGGEISGVLRDERGHLLARHGVRLRAVVIDERGIRRVQPDPADHQ